MDNVNKINKLVDVAPDSCLSSLAIKWIVHHKMGAMDVGKVEIPEIEPDFIERVLLSLVNDVSTLEDAAKKIRIKVQAMAKERGIRIPEAA